MSRQINIGYQFDPKGPETPIAVPAPYFLLGAQNTSMQFWSIQKLQEIGITRLTRLGVCDPVHFIGWDMMADLHREILLLQENLKDIEFNPEIKASWLAHLVFCYYLLVQTAPRASIPQFTIG